MTAVAQPTVSAPRGDAIAVPLFLANHVFMFRRLLRDAR